MLNFINLPDAKPTCFGGSQGSASTDNDNDDNEDDLQCEPFYMQDAASNKWCGLVSSSSSSNVLSCSIEKKED